MVGVSFLIAFSSPGATTIESAERIGMRPVMKEDRPAVQLA
jgi:formate dehydrogenase assembly factor FdhD